MYFFLTRNYGSIELADNQIISPLLFYPVTMVGIAFCLYLAYSLLQLNLCKRFVGYAGSISFHLMAQHIIIFKLFDAVYGHIIHADIQNLMGYPTGFYGMGIIYSILGVTVPMLLVYTYRKFTPLFLDYIKQMKLYRFIFAKNV